MKRTRPLLAALAGAFLLTGCAGANRSTGSAWVSVLGAGEERRARVIDFCDLPSHEGELVRVRAVYSGVEEYWGLRALTPCDAVSNVHLEDGELFTAFSRHEAWDRLRTVHEAYDRLDAVVEVVGTFESGDADGYGHLGSNPSQIDARALRVVEVREVGPRPNAPTSG